ncbi:hypothetical protein K456DRAFT_29526 [Colletotrichum gloeosporioides 23]|nr:hypothetical protein K456DRAFT_29526 [Colletotrichum gloeosporioides 23]
MNQQFMRPSGSLHLIAAVILVVVHLQGRRTVTASEHRNSGREGSGVGGPNMIRGSAPGPWSLGRGKKNGQRTSFTVFECGTWEDQVTSAVAGGSAGSGGSQPAPNEFPQSLGASLILREETLGRAAASGRDRSMFRGQLLAIGEHGAAVVEQCRAPPDQRMPLPRHAGSAKGAAPGMDWRRFSYLGPFGL